MSDSVADQMNQLMNGTVSGVTGTTPEAVQQIANATSAMVTPLIPTANWDSVDTAGVGRTFLEGSLVVNTPTMRLYTCVDSTPGHAIWNLIIQERIT